MLSVLEKLQRTHGSTEIWWDSSPLDFPAWRNELLTSAPDSASRGRWADQLARFLDPEHPERALVRGVTTNPSLVAASVLASPDHWESWLRHRVRSGEIADADHAFSAVYEEVLRRAADFMHPLWRTSGGSYGWVSGQLDPRLMFDVGRMLAQGERLASIAPNLMVKVPGSVMGYQVVRELVAKGISINGTLSYTVPQFVTCARAIEEGLAQARSQGRDLARWRAVFTHMIGRFGDNVDLKFEAAARGIVLEASDLRWAEIAVLKRIHSLIRERALPVKLLLSSLQTDEPTNGLATLSAHLEHSAGADIAYTCKPQFIAETMRRENAFEDFRPGAVDDEVPAGVLRKLNQLPSFRAAYAPDGIEPEEFAHYGCFISTYAEIMQNNRALIDFVTRQLHHEEKRTASLLVTG